MTQYNYTECGLDNVVLCNVDVLNDDDGEEVAIIKNVNALQQCIIAAVLASEGCLSDKELRFLRTYLGLTQDTLAHKLHKERITISRWERGERVIENNADALVRLLVAEKLGLDLKSSEVMEKCVEPSMKHYFIDGSNPNNYRLMDTAA